MDIRFKQHKDRLTKWLLMVALFFGIFTFSGYSYGSSSTQKQATQTEVSISNLQQIGKQTISYQKASMLKALAEPIKYIYHNCANELFAYNSLIKVRLDNSSRPLYIQHPTSHFIQVKTIPQSSDEDTSQSLIG